MINLRNFLIRIEFLHIRVSQLEHEKMVNVEFFVNKSCSLSLLCYRHLGYYFYLVSS